MNRLLVLLMVIVFAIAAVIIIGQQPSAPEVSYPARYAEIVHVGADFDASSVPHGSTIVVLPPESS